MPAPNERPGPNDKRKDNKIPKNPENEVSQAAKDNRPASGGPGPSSRKT